MSFLLCQFQDGHVSYGVSSESDGFGKHTQPDYADTSS
jgi:hypothetical protein